MKLTLRTPWSVGLLTVLASMPPPSSAEDARRRAAGGPLEGYEFVKIADTATRIPGGTGRFVQFGIPSIGGGTVAFYADGPGGQAGVYGFTAGSLTKVADKNTAVPGGSGNFVHFGIATLAGDVSVASDGSVALIGTSAAARGIYTNRTGPLTRLVDFTSTVPGNPGGTWGNFFEISHDGGQVAFTAVSTGFHQGLYLTDGTALSMIADGNTPMPGGALNFRDFGLSGGGGSPSLHDGNIAFIGHGDNWNTGVYLVTDGTLRTIADATTLVPGTPVTFSWFAEPDVRDGEVVFESSGGIYLTREGGLEPVIRAIDAPVSVLASGLVYRNGPPSVDDGIVVFPRHTTYFFEPYIVVPVKDAIVTTLTGRRQNLVDSSRASRLDGKRVRELYTGKEALSAGTFVFKAIFRNGSQAIYIARPM